MGQEEVFVAGVGLDMVGDDIFVDLVEDLADALKYQRRDP